MDENVCIKRKSKEVIRKALILIKQQKTEIERLNACLNNTVGKYERENARLKAMVAAAEEYLYPLPFKTEFDRELEKVKTDAIQEFVTKLKEHVIVHDASDGYGKACYIDVVSTIEIDNVATEMLEKDV